MKQTLYKYLFGAISAALIILTSACTPKDRYITITGFAQGGTYSVKMNLKGVSVPPEEIRDSIDAILVDIDNSQVALTQAELQRNQSIYNFLTAKVSLDKVLGDYNFENK